MILYIIDVKSWSICSLLTWKPRRFLFFSGWIWCLFCSLARQEHWGISSCNLIKTIRLWLCLCSAAGMDLGRQMILGAWMARTVERRWATFSSHEVWKSYNLDFGKALFANQTERQIGTGPLSPGTQGQFMNIASVCGNESHMCKFSAQWQQNTLPSVCKQYKAVPVWVLAWEAGLQQKKNRNQNELFVHFSILRSSRVFCFVQSVITNTSIVAFSFLDCLTKLVNILMTEDVSGVRYNFIQFYPITLHYNSLGHHKYLFFLFCIPASLRY